jgi:predicted ATPase
MRELAQISIEGFKSIKKQSLTLGRLNVLIGANGVGKSNLISAFKFLRDVFDQNLQTSTTRSGGANALLHFGRKRTERMIFELVFVESGTPYSNHYKISLAPNDLDQFFVESEVTAFHDASRHPMPYWEPLASHGLMEGLISNANSAVGRVVKSDVGSYRVYHFHDTSDSSPTKQTADINDNRVLKADAGNLAAFLYWMQQVHPDSLNLITSTIRRIAPFFDRFELQPLRLNPENIRLEWRERGAEDAFNANQLSDGTLRFICLATLLLQPELPGLILLDEPELGLHPAAVNQLAELLKLASERTQLIVSTQSVTLINQLEQQHIWVADREDGATAFRHLKSEDLSQWYQAYALGELWEKNVIGGRP